MIAAKPLDAERDHSMAIPDFQSLMLPLVKVLGDGQERTMREVTDLLAESFHLTDQEK
jgi:restriction system protein